jgi:DNA-directed RNA polymerase specialized sigma subunit
MLHNANMHNISILEGEKMSNINLPDKLGNKSLSELISQPGTKATIESKEDKQTLTVKRKEADYSFQAKIDIFSDGTKRESVTTSPNIPAKEKRQTMKAMKAEGKTQQQIADETGTSQATVSRTLNN